MPIPHIVIDTIDTNAMVTGLRSRRGSAFRFLTLVGTGRFDIHLSVPLVLEYEKVLLRELPHVHVPRSVVEDVRAKRGSRAKYEAALAQVPDVELAPYDRLPQP